MTRDFVSTVFIVKDNRVLLNFNKKVQIWVPVGGHIEPNELPTDCVIREAKEESGLDIELFSPNKEAKTANLIQPVHIHLDKVKPDHEHINLHYFGRVVGGQFTPVADDGQPSKWFSKDELLVESKVPENVKEWAIEALNSIN